MEDELRLQSRATEKCYDQIFEERKELEEKTSEEALLIVQKTYDLWGYQKERDEARRLQRSGNSRRVKKEMDLQHSFSSESCRSSTVDHVEEMNSGVSEKRGRKYKRRWRRLRGKRREEEKRMHGGWTRRGKRGCPRPES